MKNFTILIFCLFVLLSSIFAQDNSNKKLLARKINQAINIDGEIEQIWFSADSVSDYTQFRPYYGKAPTEKTVARVMFSDDALYVLIIAYDKAGVTQYRTGMLDDTESDFLSIMLDTFNDKRTAYKFAVSSTGWRTDARMLNDGRSRDYSWDGIWFAAAKRYDWGYAVEMKIPFKSIKYDVKASSWGVDFDRWILAKMEDIYWCNYSQHEGLRISKFGKLMFEKGAVPEIESLNLELYPVALAKTEMTESGKYKISPHIGFDALYNPSPALTLALTINPDFAQIEADPFKHNISRYETYFSERRTFFIEGTEVFEPEGGNYEPLDLFYSRRIGKKLPNGDEVPLTLGGKFYGRKSGWEYGALVAATGEKNYSLYGNQYNEPKSIFGVARVKKQILENSTLGGLFVAANDKNGSNIAFDIDGSVRGSDWQINYQLAESFTDTSNGFGGSFGVNKFASNWLILVKGKYISNDFNVDKIGFVPWKGTGNFVAVAGPRWFFDTGSVKELLFYSGGYLDYEKIDNYTDKGFVLGGQLNFRKLMGISFDFLYGKTKDKDVLYNSYSLNGNIWMHFSPKWGLFANINYSKTYNFYRDYLGKYLAGRIQGSYLVFHSLEIGTSGNIWTEIDEQGKIEETTLNARPYISLIPINNIKIRIFTDHVFSVSSDRQERFFVGFYFAYNFKPKSWIYFTYNELQQRENYETAFPSMKTVSRDATIKIKYLYYF